MLSPEYAGQIRGLLKSEADRLHGLLAASANNSFVMNQFAWLVGNTEGDYDEALRWSKRSVEIHGSSTCPLVLQDCKIPAGNLLGEAGKGHHIAFNVLNVGRFKLGVACIGGARHALAQMIRYAKERKAFGKPIAEFGLIQRKISSAAAQLYAAESMAYRLAG